MNRFLRLAILVLSLVIIQSLIQDCSDRFEECKDHLDDCVESPGWMTINCPKSCNTCHLRDPKIRCNPSFLNVSTEPIVRRGDLQKIFESISNRDSVTLLSKEPPLLLIENFVSEEEVTLLLEQVTHWEQSHESGEINELGEGGKVISAARTSSSFWCIHQCQRSDIVQSIVRRIESMLQIPTYHYEPLQLLKYETGQRYIPHHDYSYEELRLLCGVRIITFFLYLSDVIDGGETSFPELNLNIQPKKGNAIVWANTLNNNPMLQDSRMLHEAKPVISGTKYAANIWVHSHEWTRPSLWACTGAETTY